MVRVGPGPSLLLDVPSFTIAGDVEHVLHGAAFAPGEQRAIDGNLMVLLADGTTKQIDGGTLRVSATDASRLRTFDASNSCSTSDEPEMAPRFLAKHGPPQFLLTGDPNVRLVLHQRTLDDSAVSQISRVDTAMRVAWTADVRTGDWSCELAHIIGTGTLVLATSDASDRALALDLSTGRILWRFGRP